MAPGVDPHSEPVLLREGRSVLVREASAEDAPRIAAQLFSNLSRIMVVRLQEQAEVRAAARAG